MGTKKKKKIVKKPNTKPNRTSKKKCKPNGNKAKNTSKKANKVYNNTDSKKIKTTPQKKEINNEVKEKITEPTIIENKEVIQETPLVIPKEAKIIDEDELILINYKEVKGINKIKAFFINRHRVRKYDMKRFKKKLKHGTFKEKLLIIIMMLLILGVCACIAFCAYIVVSAPEISEKRLYKTNSTVIYDVNGNEMARIGAENREKVTYDDLPEVLVDAIIATEDSRFFQHNGVDVARFTKAVIGQLLGNEAGGASTLTMQVSKNAATSNVANGIKGIIRKFQDVYLSVFVFEKKFTKEQIFEFYVNIPNLGAGAYGVQQASQVYFGKDVSELSLSEAAIIAGLFQAPSSYNPYVHPEAAAKRRNTVLKLMLRHGYITEEEMKAANSIPVESLLIGKNSGINENQGVIDTIVQEVKDRTGVNPYDVSMKIYSTIDPVKQEVINKIYRGETYTWKNDKAQAGIAVVSVKDGSLVAVGAGRNKTTELSFNLATSARRHPGSTAKPVIDYGPAIEYLNWSTGQTIIDDQMTYTGGHSIKNHDNKYNGVLTIKKALAQSRNIPALQTFQQTTNQQKLEFATLLGWRPETDITGENKKAIKPTDIKGTLLESDSIGGFDGVTPVEAAAAYASFARGGTYIEPHSVNKIEFTESGDVIEVQPETHQAMSEETAYMINMILHYAVTSGSITAGNVSGTEICGKTGTSTIDAKSKKDLKLSSSAILDSWENTYTSEYSIALWYGYEKITSDYYLTNKEGGDARKALTKILDNGIFSKNQKLSKPKGVVTATIEIGTDPLQLASEYTPKELKSTEYFKKGTVPKETSNRFAQLNNPTDVRYLSSDSIVNITWKATPLPDVMTLEYLTNYFNEAPAYQRWADTYLQERLQWNNDNLGSFGYRIYQKIGDNVTEIGFTTSNTFSATLTSAEPVTYIVKTSYEKFTSNQSSGVSINVTPNNTNITTTTTSTTTDDHTTTTKEPVTISIDYLGPSCSTVSSWNGLGSTYKEKFKVTAKTASQTSDVTEAANIECSIYDEQDNPVTTPLEQNKYYEISCSITYQGKNYPKKVILKKTC